MRSPPPPRSAVLLVTLATLSAALSAPLLFGVASRPPGVGSNMVMGRPGPPRVTGLRAAAADPAAPAPVTDLRAAAAARAAPAPATELLAAAAASAAPAAGTVLVGAVAPAAPSVLRDISRVYMPYQSGPAAAEAAAVAAAAAAPSPPTGRLVLLAGAVEGDCAGRYNVGCKFFHYLRCGVFGHLPVFRWVRSVDEYLPHAAAGDVVMVIDRPSDTTAAPPEVAALLAARDTAHTIPAAVAVGIYHTADEGKHPVWGWYDRLDLVLRNYWVADLANTTAHPALLHVPIGPAAPNACVPASPAGLAINDLSSAVPDAGVDVASSAYCTCPGLPPLARASARPVGYHLSAFVHQSRQDLFDAVAASAAADAAADAAAAAGGAPRPPRLGNGTGIVVAHNTFGGASGTVGSPVDDPKIAYLAAMASAALVYVPCGNVGETHRLYEAMLTGGVPLVARCEESPRDWMPAPPGELLHGDAAGRGAHAGMVATAQRLLADPAAADALQAETARRWADQLDGLAAGVRRLVVAAVARRAAVAARPSAAAAAAAVA